MISMYLMDYCARMDDPLYEGKSHRQTRDRFANCQARGPDHVQVNSRRLQGLKKQLVILWSQGLDQEIDSIIGRYHHHHPHTHTTFLDPITQLSLWSMNSPPPKTPFVKIHFIIILGDHLVTRSQFGTIIRLKT